MNNSPPVTPRPVSLQNNKKSRIPLATSQNVPGSGHVSRGMTTFRQWADPPPPPPRSRTLERKFPNAAAKKRPGSADPRFRRSLESTKTHIHQHNEPVVVLAEVKKKSSSACDLTSDDTNEKLTEPQTHVLFDKNDKLDILKITDQINLDRNIESIVTSETNQLDSFDEIPIRVKRNPVYDYDHLIDSYEPINKEEIAFNDRLTEKHLKTSRAESKYSQTDMLHEYRTDINEILSPQRPGKTVAGNDIIQYISANYEQQSRYLDGLVLNRTRSISTVYELEPVTKIKPIKRRNFGSISRVFLAQNYWTCLEIWAAISLLTIILLFGWYYLLPYISDAFFTWIYPSPPMTASDYIRRSLTDIFSSTSETLYSLLTTPANRRLL